MWGSMAERLGLHGLLVPEGRGGLGGSYLDLGVVLAEAGRATADLPLMSSAGVATSVLLAADELNAGGPAAEILERMVDEAEVVVVVPPGGDMPKAVPAAGGSWLLSGHCRTVLDLPWAGRALVFAGIPEGVALFEVGLGESMVLPCAAHDPTRAYGDLDLDGTPGTLVAPDADGHLRRDVIVTSRVGLALDAAGGARKCLELAVEYAGTREQFGRPIGSFQAIKHKCADVLLRVEAATSAAEAAAWVLSQSGSTAAAALDSATLAKTYATEAFVHASGELIQILGGIGFTWEHPAHLFYKRAKSDSLLGGVTASLRKEEAARLGLLSTL
jgi:alkylation response protein AidB-like acyl-CoA dehydrogenase